MKTSHEKLEGTKVKLTVTVPAADVDEAVGAAYKKIAAKMKIPGFRPGKAPRAVIDNHVGKEYVLAEATEELVNTSYSAALDLERLRPIDQAELGDVGHVVAGSDFTYEAQVDVRPELTLSSIDDLKIELDDYTVKDDEIEAQIDQYRERYASLEPVEDRGVEEGDFALISFVGTVEGEEYEGNVVDKYLYELGRGLMPAEFDKGLIGLKSGDETHVEFEIPDTSSNPEFVGKTAGFEVTVHEIKAKVMPEADDEFAANVGGYDTMAELRDALRTQAENEKKYAMESARERAVREAIAERLEGDIPQPMVEMKKERLLRDFRQSLSARDMAFEDYLAAAGTDEEAVNADMARLGEQGVREELALEALARQLGLEVSDADIDEELQSIAASSDELPEVIRSRWEDAGLMSVVQEEIMHRHAMEWLRDKVEVVEISEEADAETASADEGKKPTKKKRASKKKTAEDDTASADEPAGDADAAE